MTYQHILTPNGDSLYVHAQTRTLPYTAMLPLPNSFCKRISVKHFCVAFYFDATPNEDSTAEHFRSIQTDLPVVAVNAPYVKHGEGIGFFFLRDPPLDPLYSKKTSGS